MNLETGHQVDHLRRELRASILTKLVEKGIEKVVICFDGYGDEGQIEGITATRADGGESSLEWFADIPGKEIGNGDRVWDGTLQQHVYSDGCRPMTMHELMEEWAFELIGIVQPGWETEDGSYGEIVIFPAGNSVQCDFHNRYTEVEITHHEL
jgi:hypothetical protein